jgi:hypothetical protein
MLNMRHGGLNRSMQRAFVATELATRMLGSNQHAEGGARALPSKLFGPADGQALGEGDGGQLGHLLEMNLSSDKTQPCSFFAVSAIWRPW